MKLLIFLCFIKLIINNQVLASSTTTKYHWGQLGQYPNQHECNPYQLTRDDTTMKVDDIINSIHREFKSIKQIASESKINEKLVKKKMTIMVKCDFVKQVDDKFIVNFPVYDKETVAEMNKIGEELSIKALKIYNQKIEKVKQNFEKTTLRKNGYVWEDIAVALVGGLLFDVGIHDRALKKFKIFDLSDNKDMPVNPGGYYYWFIATENGFGSQYWKFGHENYDNTQSKFGLFRGTKKGMKRNWDPIWDLLDDPNVQNILFKLVENNEIPLNEIQKLSHKMDNLTILKKLAEYQFIKLNTKSITINFPVFNPADVKIIIDEINLISEQIVLEIYKDEVDKILQLWQKIKPKHWMFQKSEKMFLRQTLDRVYNISLTKLIAENKLPKFTEKNPYVIWGINDKNYSLY
ncbi:hypothetical protein MEO40_20540 [Dolichospermum sp. ST_sed1]|nr:hypothetical protein [Dolichospermum sp. ST_sed1]